MKVWVALVMAAVGCTASSGESVSRRDCVALRDHLVELRLEATSTDRDQHRAAVQASLGEAFVGRCLDGVTREQLRCSLDAKSSQALSACNEL
jgi:hypothetical protein